MNSKLDYSRQSLLEHFSRSRSMLPLMTQPFLDPSMRTGVHITGDAETVNVRADMARSSRANVRWPSICERLSFCKSLLLWNLSELRPSTTASSCFLFTRSTLQMFRKSALCLPLVLKVSWVLWRRGLPVDDISREVSSKITFPEIPM